MRASAIAVALSLFACDRVRPAPAPPPPVASSSASAPVVIASSSASAAPSAAPAAPARRTDLNLLVLSVDSLRADMPWAGYPRAIAPRLTELEKKSVSYTRGYSISSYTSMSLGGFLGGKLPSGLKRDGFFFGKYHGDNRFFPEVLKSKGVKTIAGHAHGYFNGGGFDQGFDAYEVVKGIVFKNETDPNVTSPKHEELAERLLSDPALETQRFFAWFHFLDPHDQYVSHEADGIPAFGKSLRDRYDAEVLYTDRYIGKLLDFVAGKSWGERTAILVTADHGEAFGEHGRYNHGFELWENLVRVPIFFYVPGAKERRIDVPRSGLDLAPTILELFGIAASESEMDLEGTSLVSEIYGGPAAERDVVLDLPMTSDNDKRRALVHGKWKILATGGAESLRLYDLENDQAEDKPITKGETFDEMAKRYKERSRAIKEVPPYACNVGCLNGAYAKK